MTPTLCPLRTPTDSNPRASALLRVSREAYVTRSFWCFEMTLNSIISTRESRFLTQVECPRSSISAFCYDLGKMRTDCGFDQGGLYQQQAELAIC
jgi:hypothetical protein